MPEPVADPETLSRFIFDRKHIRSNNTLRHSAFMPNKYGETSVFRISGISQEQIWEIASDVARLRDKQLLGRGDILASTVFSKDLQVIPREPPKRHANILGWPNDPSLTHSIAQQLAAEAVFYKFRHEV